MIGAKRRGHVTIIYVDLEYTQKHIFASYMAIYLIYTPTCRGRYSLTHSNGTDLVPTNG